MKKEVAKYNVGSELGVAPVFWRVPRGKQVEKTQRGSRQDAKVVGVIPLKESTRESNLVNLHDRNFDGS